MDCQASASGAMNSWDRKPARAPRLARFRSVALFQESVVLQFERCRLRQSARYHTRTRNKENKDDN
jgi:hypothetical protein